MFYKKQFAMTKLRCRLAQPDIAVFDNFLSEFDCKRLINEATPHLKRSTVVGTPTEPDVLHDARTSSGMFFQRGASPLVRAIETRLAALTNTDIKQGEGLQVLRYEPGQRYDAHNDWFDPASPGQAAQMTHGGQRLYSCILYLNDDFDGGETDFPLARLRVTPKRGSVCIFRNLTTDIEPDVRTLHGGLPPSNGTKYVATKWIRLGEFK